VYPPALEPAGRVGQEAHPLTAERNRQQPGSHKDLKTVADTKHHPASCNELDNLVM